MSLCRVPSLHPCTLLPPALFRVGGGVSDRMLDQALMESEVSWQSNRQGRRCSTGARVRLAGSPAGRVDDAPLGLV